MNSKEFKTPFAFQRSLMDRIKAMCDGDGKRMQDIRLQFAIEAFYRRLLIHSPEAWVVKGGCAIAQRTNYYRFTKDIDLSFTEEKEPQFDTLRDYLNRATRYNTLDHYTFSVERLRPLIGVANAYKATIEARLEKRFYGKFDVDIVPPHPTVGTIQETKLILPLEITDIPNNVPAKLFPVEDHIADKVSGMYTKHTAQQLASTRYRDLADLAVLLHSQPYNPLLVEQALRQRAATRPGSVPRSITQPGEQWPAAFANYARKARINITYEQAIATAAHYLNPILKRVHSRPGAGPSMTRDAGRSL